MINPDNSTVTWPCQVMGRKDGADVVNMGPGKSFDVFKSTHTEEKTGTVDLEFIQN